ncbi:MAG: clostripain-related cysteine peptidase [Clostridia bacterium]|nr:clostripain-related cysteine peptidase [Clostridia bacterium]
MKKALSIILILVITTLCFTNVLAFQSTATIEIGGVSSDIQKKVKPLKEKDWTVCVYMCGTDLETRSAAATTDLLEMLAADIPEDINVLVMTGGTKQWNPYEDDKVAIENGVIKEGGYVTPDNEHTQIYLIDDDKMNLIYTYDKNLDMGDVCTLETFLEFALYYAPSEHLMVSLWNHGGGPLSGVEYDEISQNIMSTPEYTAFAEALYKARGKKTDILSFDACLMGNLEIALNVAPFADYIVASAETEPGAGWLYDWMSIFNEAHEEGRTVEAIEVGERIIDTYPANEGNDWANTSGLTLALYDLSKADELKVAFDNLATELYAALDTPELYSQISRRAEKVLSMYSGDPGLIDLYDYASDMSDLLPSAKALMEVLGGIPEGENKYHGKPDGEDTFVIYRGVSPDYRECLGVTFFYPTSKTPIKDQVSAGKTAIEYTGLEMSQAYNDFIYELLLRTDKIQYFKGELALEYDYDREEIVVEVENPEDTIALSYVDYTLIYTKIDEDGTETSYDLGCAPVVNDWENGVFEVPFDGKWCAIDGEIFTCELEEGGYYDTCLMPIMIEGNTDISILTTYILPEDPSVAYLGPVYDIDYSGVVSRSYLLDKDSKFKTVLIEENDYGKNYEYYTYKVNEKVITPFVTEYAGVEELALNVEEIDLAHSTDAKYMLQGRAWDMKSQVFYTDAMEMFLSNDIGVFSIAPIEPQIYTGNPVTPKIGLRYLEYDILLTSDFKVRYENNTEKGAAKAIVEVDDGKELKGELVSEFLIKDISEIYPDTTKDSWYFENLVDMQLLGAVPDTDNLNADITRGEFVDMLYNFYNPGKSNIELAYTDVTEDSPWANAVKWALEAGVIRGITDKTFAPDKKITRLEMIVMLARFDEERENPLTATEPEYHLADCNNIPSWGKNAVHWAVANGIIHGNNGSILPDDYVKVSEAIAMISRCAK